MDIKEVPGDRGYFATLEMIKENAKRARRRKGERPQDHPPPWLLVARFMMSLSETGSLRKDKDMVYTSQVPAYYPPCVRSIEELKPLMISGMTLENHHRKNKTLIHVLTPPDRFTSVTAIVEDEEGTALLLQLYNQPEESNVNKDYILQQGDVCIIKEPFFKATTEGSYSLRVDHVSDIIWLHETDDRIPLKWRKRILNLDEDSEDIRIQGNKAVQKWNWAEAERLYTNAIRTAKTSKERQLAHLNRSLCNLHLGRPEKALDDALRGDHNGDPLHEKALFRQAKALYALGRFAPCYEKLLLLVRSNPKNSDAWAEIRRVNQRLREEETGSYQFSSMYKQSEATPPLIDCATYIGSVAVRDSPGRGKGLFTTKQVKAGELLLCEKAFGYCYAGDDSSIGQSNTTILVNVNNNTIARGGQANLLSQIVQKIYHNPTGAEILTDLHHGDYTPVTTSKVDGDPVVDTFLVTKIIQQNSFGAPRTSKKTILGVARDTNGEPHGKSARHTTCGVWPIASRINHSCVPNCRRAFIGDMHILRACGDIEADTELCFEYHQPESNETYETTQDIYKNWKFVCECALCLNKKNTPLKTVNERKALAAALGQTLRPDASIAQLTRSAKVLERLNKTFAPRQDVPLLGRPELWDPYFALGGRLIGKGKLMEGLEMLLKGFEALGYIIVASPPRDSKVEENKKQVTLEIKRWGYATPHAVGAFLEMLDAYKILAPKLCNIVKRYAGVAYCICFGENETIGTTYPELAQVS